MSSNNKDISKPLSLETLPIATKIILSTGVPQKLALGLSVGKGLLRQINLTTFIRPWSCQWGHGLISGVSINTHYALKMPNSYIFITQVNIVNVKVDL